MNLIGEIVIDKIRLNQKIKKMSDLVNLVNSLIIILEGEKDNYNDENCKIIFEDNFNDYLIELNLDYEFQKQHQTELDKLKNIFEFLKDQKNEEEIAGKGMQTESIAAELKRITQLFKDDIQELLFVVEHLNLITGELQEGIMQMRMLPISQLFDKVPRIVRTLAQDLKKKIAIQVFGEETQLDKTVIEKLTDPLTHLIRNSVDHGIEMPEDRIKKGKNPEGILQLKAAHKGNQVEITIEDDGKGINDEVILKKAISTGLVSPEKAAVMKKSEIIELIFAPGFSSAEKVTEVSGRGVGMDVVLSNIKKLKGVVEVESEINKGSKIIIRLPLTMAIMQVQLIKCANQILAVPINFIEEVKKIKIEEIMYIGIKSVFNLREEIISLVRLNEVLEITSIDDQDNKYCQVMITKISDKRIGFIIDGLVGQQEIVIKSLGKILKNIKHISGATILGEGNVILILDILGIFNTAKKIIEISSDPYAKPSGDLIKRENKIQHKEKKKILITDDSRTMRLTLKSNLQEAGYNVIEAKDGVEALEKVKNEKIDLFTVDVMMPGMSGYDLTKKIRGFSQHTKTPIIIVSSQSEKVDKMRGLDAGADEYIIKPYEKTELINLVKSFLE